MITSTKIYILLFMFVAIGYILYFASVSTDIRPLSEHFTSSTDDMDNYEARLHVIKVFDGYLHRKPTMEEITKYSVYKNEQDILGKVMEELSNTKDEEEPVTNIVDTFQVDSKEDSTKESNKDTIVNKTDPVEVSNGDDKKEDTTIKESVALFVPKINNIIQELQDISTAMSKL